MKATKTLLTLALMAGCLSAGAQTVERSFYIDYGQNNVSGQGYKTVGADANGHYWNNIFGKGTGAPDKAYPQTISLVTSDNTATDCKLQISRIRRNHCLVTLPSRVPRRTTSSLKAVKTTASSISRDSTSAKAIASFSSVRVPQPTHELPIST